MTNEPAGSRGRLPLYTWLPRAAEVWSDPGTGKSTTAPRFVLAMILIGGQVLLTAATPVWGAAASLVSGVLALAAWPLRRRSTRPSVDSAWVERAKTAVRLIRPVKDPEGPVVATEVAAQGGTVLDPVRSAAALRAAANLLMAAGSDPKVLQLVGADEPEDEEDEAPDEERGETWVGDCLLVHDDNAAFVLELDCFDDPDDPHDEDERERQRALLARIAGTFGVTPPALPGRPGAIPDELRVTADDLRAFADAGLATAQRLEQQFATTAVDGPSDVALDLGRTRAWPSRVDTMSVTALTGADPVRIAAVLRGDLAAQAALDRAREQRDEDSVPPLTDEWERRWHLYLERYAARPAAAQEPDDMPADQSRSLTPTARAALLLAVTADGPLRTRAAGSFGVGAVPTTRRIPWPRHRRLAVAGDRVLLAITVYVVPFSHLWVGTVR
ncbi:hypothetical protein [Actinacidiphila soli]|uniref:hypothetical protein n=1 Tax=Actinacidiphila soli TaxID=2487275 RepID=UPI000FC9C199|nr:hypothetical protein [Actinacidiphila soli]